MTEPEKKMCPLSFDGEKFEQECIQTGCAWWKDGEMKCALEAARQNDETDGKPIRLQAPEDRRAHRRLALEDCTVRYKAGIVLGLLRPCKAEPCPVVNVSNSGLQFLNNDALRPHQYLRMKVSLPEATKPVRVAGFVVWESAGNDIYLSRVGVEFTKHSEAIWKRHRVLERTAGERRSGQAEAQEST